jgi:hypothetical protein
VVLVVVGEVLVQDDGTKRTSLERWEERNGGEERERHEEVLPAWWVVGSRWLGGQTRSQRAQGASGPKF